MFKRLGYHSDEMLLAAVVWLCSLPLIGFIVIPIFGWEVAGVAALTVLLMVAVACWGICSWNVYRR